MTYRQSVFTHPEIYDLSGTDTPFLNAVRANVHFHQRHCPEYARLLDSEGFEVASLRSTADLHRIPVIPTAFFKSHRLYSLDERRFVVRATSSGTKGSKSEVGFDVRSVYYGLRMLFSTFRYHRLISPLPTNYIVLGYEPSRHNPMGAAKTASLATRFAPALRREFALKDTGSEYRLNLDGLERALRRYSKMGLPVRFVGFPAYMYFLVKELKDNGIRLRLNKRSKVLLGGGWKQFTSEQMDKRALYELIRETLGIQEADCKEFFSAVEHPVAYCDCRNHHFHVPVFSRVIVRDVNTLQPVRHGEVGLLSFVTPLVESMPLVSVVTDDLAVMYDGRQCGCGISSPYFEVLERAGLAEVVTCAATAADLLGGVSQ